MSCFSRRFFPATAAALICGVILTTMPITIIGNAFAAAWEKKEVIEVAMDVQEFLQERGLKPRDVENVFKEFDPDGSGTLDWDEFYGAMQVLNSKLPFNQAKRLFGLFDNDGNGRVDQAEFCSLIFPGMDFGQGGPPEFDASEARTTTGGGRVSMGDSPTGGSVIGLLEVVESDFTKTLAEMTATEATAAAEYERQTKENEVMKTMKEQDVKYKTKESTGLDKAIGEMTSDREGVETELASIREYLEKLHEMCVAKAEPYEERKARREAEIAGLKEALTILEGEAVLLQGSAHNRLRGVRRL